MRITKFWLRPFVGLLLCAGLGIVAASECNAMVEQDRTDSNRLNESENGDEADSVAIDPASVFTPDFDDQDLAGSSERAWEYRPYSVAVWFCLDGSPGLNSVYKQVARDVTRRSELMDPSGWDLSTGIAPSRWRNRLLEFIATPEKCAGLESSPAIQTYDKLMVVCLDEASGKVRIRVREFDVQTQQWGPLLIREVAQKQQLGANIMDAISIAFMPLAKIDRIQELEYTDAKGTIRKKDEVVMQIRAIRSCVRTMINEEMNLESRPIESSPVFIKTGDHFMPIIRKTDRAGNLVSLDPIEFTYLTVNSMDEAVLRASIESYHRAPLSQRKSKRAEKLALVIRPPERSTKLFLVSSDKQRTPMEGFEVVSRRPGAVLGEKNEYIGKTDWQGSIDIPPSPDGLRIILVRRGSRGLKRLPMIPGLYESVESTLPNDETRLYAEGVVRGLQNEILSMVIQREVFEKDVSAAIEQENLEAALQAFNSLKALSIMSVKERMSDDEIRLKSMTSDSRELGFINSNFDSLRKILNDQQKKSKESELQQVIQQMRESKIASPTQ